MFYKLASMPSAYERFVVFHNYMRSQTKRHNNAISITLFKVYYFLRFLIISLQKRWLNYSVTVFCTVVRSCMSKQHKIYTPFQM